MNQSWIFVYFNRGLFDLFCFESPQWANLPHFVLEVTKFGGNPWLPISSVKPAAVYGHWFGQLLWLCSGPAQSLGVFPSYLPVHLFQRPYEREVHGAPHSNLLWVGRTPERLTHSLIKVSRGKMTWEKSVIIKTETTLGTRLEDCKVLTWLSSMVVSVAQRSPHYPTNVPHSHTSNTMQSF